MFLQNIQPGAFCKNIQGNAETRHSSLAPSQFEAMFLSTAHTDEVIDETLCQQ